MDLDPAMSVADFQSSYFYAADLRQFAQRLGMTVGNARKHEVEALILEYLRTGEVPEHRPVNSRRAGAPRDALDPGNQVLNYVGDARTKQFLFGLARFQAPGLADKTGQWYWLNDWRREQQAAGAEFSYRDLGSRLRALMQTEGRLPQIPSARMNNFLTDFRADPANSEFSRENAMDAWEQLKAADGPKTYEHWTTLRAR